jgi:hypothetical protein
VVTFTSSFTSPLQTSAYLVFTDVEFGEKIYVKAYNGASLIPFGDLAFTKWNGNSSSGTSVNTTWNVEAGDVAASRVPEAYTVEVIEHVPALTKATAPVLALTVQTPVVEDAYVTAPPASDGVATSVGGVALKAYDVDSEEVMARLRATGGLGVCAIALESALAPAEVLTRSRTVYSVPLATPEVMTSGLADEAGERVTQLVPSSSE